MLKPKELRFSGIGPFIEEQIVNFDELGQLAQIVGDSGAGKTSILNAQEFLFGVNDLPNTVLETYLTKMPLSVSMDFDYDGKNLTITRAKNKLTIDLDGEVITGSNKLAEEKLDEIIGMPRDLFRPLLLKRQKEGGFFLNFTPKEKYEFMSSALGLGGFQTKLDNIDAKLSILTKDGAKLETERYAASNVLEITKGNLANLGEVPVQTVTQEAVLALKQRADESKEALKQLQLGQKGQIDILEQQRPVLQRPVLETPEFNGSSIATAEAFKATVEEKIRDLRDKESFRVAQVNKRIQELTVESFGTSTKVSAANTAKAEAIKVAAEIKKIRAGICSTCEQAWVHDSAKAKEAELMGKISAYRAQIEAGAQAGERAVAIEAGLQVERLALAPQVDPELVAAEAELKEANLRLAAEQAKKDSFQKEVSAKNKALSEEFHAKLNAANAEFAATEKAVRESLASKLEEARNQNEAHTRAFDQAYSELQAQSNAKKRYEHTHGQLASQFEEYSAKVASFDQQQAQLTKQLSVIEELKRAVKAYVSSKFDDALVSVADAATTMIRRIPNMANATIQLEGNRETKDGKIKEEVNAVIHKDGFENVHIKSLSGGERTSVDIAIDLAVIDFLEERTNKGIAVYNMDEPFNGLRSEHIEQILEMLQGYESNKRIILIDHNPIIEEFVTSKIRVSKTGTSSSISLI